ncbi:MAG TPA: sigma-70 family RNA polymerase sigma factor [Planctomycetota bacterium]|nr:sigma-70 family RNA polymerase sigma factor [Planctomycetota bacterium]
MTTGPSPHAVAPETGHEDDHALLARFADDGSEEAFAEVVRRHTPLVHGVCRRVLGDAHAAEDASQAAFLVLMRKARHIRRGQSVAAWLHVTAHQAALQHRRAAMRRRRREREAAAATVSEPYEEPDRDALRRALDSALASLPGMQRAALVARYLQNKSQAEAAAELGCAPETVHTHVTRALARLRERLRGRGVAVGGAGLIAFLTEAGAHAAPAGLDAAIATGCVGGAAAGGVAATIANQVVVAWKWALAKTIATVAAGAAVVVAAPVAVIVLSGTPAPRPGSEPAAAIAPAETTAPAPVATWRCHDLGIGAIAVRADGVFITGGWDKRVRLWRADGTMIGEGVGHTHAILKLAFSRDGRQAVSASTDATAALWTLPALSVTATMRHDQRATCVAFAPDGTFATSGFDGIVRRWAADGGALATMSGHSRPVWSLAFSPDGALLASACDEHLVGLWDAATGERLGELVGHGDAMRSVAFSPDGRRIVSGGNDGTARIWDARTRQEIVTLRCGGLVPQVAWSPDGRWLAAAVTGQGVRLWRGDGADGSILVPQPTMVNFAFDTGLALLTSADDGVVRRWDLTTLRVPGSIGATP